MASEKTPVIEYLYDHIYVAQNRSIITLDDVKEAINFCRNSHNIKLSSNNPANFFKDFIRGKNSSSNWPERLWDNHITARQVTGNSHVFEFIIFEANQKEPFPEKFLPSPAVKRFPVQTVTLNLASRELGRSDEPWLIQTAVNLKIVEQFLAVMSDINFIEISHLQMSVKLKKTEIDSVFLGKYKVDDKTQYAYITCEAKQKNDPILHDQIIRQVEAVFQIMPDEINSVIPIALKAIQGTGIHLIEFQKLEKESFSRDMDTLELQIQKDAIFELHPPIQGIC